ncbi:hypothetical protein BFP77_11755 [Maribacter sp. 4U21]|uniref:hypothetical protein n=1 Tax=Maribacter sp. 4U21 TaxID=1889779 RepID=UPI000C1462F0|nr:hypothetical protein [Maribacter sp. 4U21]PIB27557.1 hypothetical protein BFP77_11755 [Maribacter sp. 4U21]
MKKINFHHIKFMIMASLVTVSCSDDDYVADSEDALIAEQKVVSLEGNILAFDSEETLIALLEDKEGTSLKVEEFIQEGFTSLKPNFSDLEGPEVEAYLSAKAERLSSKGALYTNKTGKNNDIDTEDEIIADETFASILNEDREIIVGNNYYIYTTDGLYFIEKSKKDKLVDYLQKLESSSGFTSRSMKALNAQGQNFYGKEDNELVVDLNPVSGRTIKIDDDINVFVVETEEDVFGPKNKGANDESMSGKVTPILAPHTFPVAQYTENSLFQKIFGNTIDVNQYHDSTHRIKTKFWNQNYLLWATVGAEARYQKKRFIGWSESDTSDGVRLGINNAVYTYTSNVSPYNPNDPNRVILKYKGVSYNPSGQVVPQYPMAPSTWPINQTATVAALEITIFGNDIYYPITGSTANSTINNLLSQARSIVPGLNADLEADKVRVNIVKYLPNSFQVTEADILLKHRSEASKTFDFNFLISFKSSSSGFSHLANQLNAEKYKSIEIDMYGAALRNNVWLGTRIRGKAK